MESCSAFGVVGWVGNKKVGKKEERGKERNGNSWLIGRTRCQFINAIREERTDGRTGECNFSVCSVGLCYNKRNGT